ncbi:glycerol-3-phosphate 1-O-acyltransferase PlsY [Pistricoccus aurantiacus]|uniref:Glycerol-3-phosphate acyltransferase n=1 Tax=Pistricoccus aurantiacus TaxID=1883414 RepID=A0A5B8SWH2_9GAMM|nr:glycerol-3-phosphate 1-O-acyltransferase PlsY [Pistricoccus aurantiacus]QEA39110.1 glycerol-3-phosphate 1-O-acyltransferase PlsY [Pistricoccus aurantiacus]
MPPSSLVTLVGALMLLAYLCGSWLGALSVCRLAGLGDPRQEGSCNPGFSNMLRLHGPRLALTTLMLDAVKGVPVLLIAKALALPNGAQGLIGLCVLLGHSYPLWYGFKGGKAVASAFGVLLVLTPSLALICAACWMVLAWRVRTAAVASLVSAMLAPVLAWWLAPDYLWMVAAITLLVLLRHGLNIRRLRQKAEPRLDQASGSSQNDRFNR